MKKTILIFTLFILTTLSLKAQEYYWTSYSFNVEAEDVEIVSKLTNDYFSAENSKADGVSVYLFENHFHDSSLSSSHELVFAGTYDAMGNQYSQGENISWDLYLAKLGQYTKGVFCRCRKKCSFFWSSRNTPCSKFTLAKNK